jgi:titin
MTTVRCSVARFAVDAACFLKASLEISRIRRIFAIPFIALATILCLQLRASAGTPPGALPLYSSVSGTTVTLVWTPPSGATSYNLYRGLTSGGESATPIASGLTGTTYADTGLAPGTEYFYEVVAVNAYGSSPYSAESPEVTIPIAPPNVTITPEHQMTSLNWGASANGGQTYYNVYRGLTPGGESTTPVESDTLWQAAYDDNLTDGTTYYYVVKAFNGAGMSGPSVEVSAAPIYGYLPAPTSLVAAPGNSQVGLSWTPVAGASSYDLYRTTNKGWAVLVDSNITATSFVDTGLVNGATYYYAVSAVNGGITFYKTAEVSATPGTQYADVPTNLTASTANDQVDLSWTVPSGAVSYNVYRGTVPSGESTTPIATGVTGTGSAVTYNDTSVTSGTYYYYQVAAVNTAGTSGYSNEAGAVAGGTSPTIESAASATPSPVVGTTVHLSALGADNGGASHLTYTWATTGTPPGSVTYSANGTNAAQNTTATLTAVGTYTFQVTITDAAGLSTTSSVSVFVSQTITGIAVSPTTVSLLPGASQQFAATANDQFGAPLALQPQIVWSLATGAVGTISSTGLYNALTAPGTDTVNATSGAVIGTASTTVKSNGPTVVTAASASPNPVTGTSTNLSVLGADSGGAASLIYQWSVVGTPPAPVTFSVNGTNAAQNTVVTFDAAGAYSFMVTITDSLGLSVTSSVTVTVAQTISSIYVSPPGVVLPFNGTQQFTAGAEDQFWNAMASQPNFTWSVPTGAAGAITSTGLYSSSATSGTDTIQATSGGVVGIATVTITPASPYITANASATPNPATNYTTQLSVSVQDDLGGTNLTYTWAAVGVPPAPVTFSVNSTTAAQNTTATFTASGQYCLQVTVTDKSGMSVTSLVNVSVLPVVSSITVTPVSATVGLNSSALFTAVALDKLGNPLPNQPVFTWSLSPGPVGTISNTGLYTAANVSGTDRVNATAVGVTGTAVLTVTGAPTITSISPTSGTSGTTVTVTGTNLCNILFVTCGGVQQEPVRDGTVEGAGPTSLVVHPTATGPISIVTQSGTAVSPVPFVVTYAPTITGFSPTSVPIAQLNHTFRFTLTGTNFPNYFDSSVPTGEVLINGNKVACSWVTSNEMFVYPGAQDISEDYGFNPSDNISSGYITLEAPNGTAVSSTPFTISNSLTPPTFAPTVGGVGTVVTISGAGLADTQNIYFPSMYGSFVSVAITSVTPTSVTVVVPTNASSGPIMVVTSESRTFANGVFYLSPTIGAERWDDLYDDGDDWVMIYGTGLAGTTSVTIDGVPAAFFSRIYDSDVPVPSGQVPPITFTSSWGHLQIYAKVPAGVGGGIGPVAVTTPGGTATTDTIFSESATAPEPSVTGGDSSAYIFWNRSVATYYNVYRATSPAGNYVKINTAPVTSLNFLDAGPLTNGSAYFYEVTSVLYGTESAPSAPVYGLPNVHVNCGGPQYLSSTTDVNWAADYGFNAGQTDSTAATIGNTLDPTLYQTERTGNSFNYSFPVNNGQYTLAVGFAENDGNTTGQRPISVMANGTPLASNLDVYAAAGGANKAYTVSNTIYITNGYLNLAFSGNTAEVATISLTTPNPVSDQPVPGWAEGVVPNDGGGGGENGPSSSDNVDLASGVFENSPGPDITAYNPVGPSASYTRFYRSAFATAGYSSPGLSPGWVDSYDLTVTAVPNSLTGALALHYPNGGSDIWTPGTGTNGPLSNFIVPQNAPYFVTANASGSLTVTLKDHTQETFTPSAGIDLYRLTQITNIVGNSININRDTTGRILSVQNSLSTGSPLLAFNYSGPFVSSIVAMDTTPVGATTGREVFYTYDANNNLVSASQLVDVSSNDSPPARWQYGYQSLGTISLLSSAETPSPTGTGTSATTVVYDAFGRASSHTSADGAVKNYLYGTASTAVQDTSTTGAVAQTWTQNFAPNNVNTGFTDANNKSDLIAYGAGNTQFLPSSYTNRNQQTGTVNYDSYGNITVSTDARGIQSFNQYTYPSNFPLGQLNYSYNMAINSTTGATTTGQAAVYAYTASGLVSQVSVEAPGTVNGGNSTAVNTNYTYDALGNVTQVTTTGPNSGLITTTYNYRNVIIPGQGSYSQEEAVGEPLSVTTSGVDGHGVTTSTAQYFKYDGRGEKTASVDALGNETDYAYDDAGDLIQTVYPPSSTGGSIRACTQLTYQYPDGPVTKSCLYSNFGVPTTPFRQINYTYGAEGELLSVTGDTEPVSYTYDPLYRVTSMNGTNYSYDSVGNLARIQYPSVPTYGVPSNHGANGSNIQTFSYDADQNLIQKINGNGDVTTYTRNDPESQVTGVAYSTLGGLNLPQFANIQYNDPFGRPSSVTDLSGTKSYTYDDIGSILSTTTSFRGGPQNQTINYQYNLDGSRANMSYSVLHTAGYSPVTANQSYYYDGIGRLQTVNFASGAFDENCENYDYYSNGWLMDDYLNGGYGLDFGGEAMPTAAVSYQYDPRGDVTGLVNQVYTPKIGIGMSSNFSMLNQDGSSAYDAAGNRLTETSSYPQLDGVPARSQTVNYTYDNRDELTSVSPSGFGDSYVEDGSGNIADINAPSQNSGNTNGPAQSFDADNELVSWTQYDGEGNPTIAANASALFDPENRLVSLNSGTYFSAQYDSGGHRTVQNFLGQGAVFYLYDGDDPVEEMDSNGVVLALNGFGGDGLRLRTLNDSTAGYYTYDPQGNLVQQLHLSGGTTGYILDNPSYWSAFGRQYDVTGAAVPGGQYQFGFGGKYGYYQDQTGLDLLGCRYYDPIHCRFLTRDPTGYKAGPNLYEYCGNNPITRCDPKGTDDAEDIISSAKSGGRDVGVDIQNAATNNLAKKGIAAGVAVSATVPLCNAIEAQSGQDASGKHVNWFDRGLSLVSVFVGGLGGAGEKAAGEATQLHHIFPQSGEFAAQWDRLGFNIHDFTIRIPESLHYSMHGNRGGAWNAAWREFFEKNRLPSFKEVTDFADSLLRQYGIDKLPLVNYSSGK